VRIDLHVHSNASDGTEPPGDVVRAAAREGLDVVALADHDTTAGLAEAAVAAESAGVVLIPGIELSTRTGGISVHMLALWVDMESTALQTELERIRSARVERAREIVARLARDHPLEWDDVLARSEAADSVGRPHIADALVDAGVAADRDEVFAGLLKTGSPYYVPHYAPDTAEAIALVREAKAVPVLAHVGAVTRGRILADADIEALASVGLVGLEVDHRDHDDRQIARLARLAERLGLVRTGGSDYHGTGKVNRLGERLTSPEAYSRLQEARG
jgi:predicted metal-dependent phosphoesterase TrpH